MLELKTSYTKNNEEIPLKYPQLDVVGHKMDDNEEHHLVCLSKNGVEQQPNSFKFPKETLFVKYAQGTGTTDQAFIMILGSQASSALKQAQLQQFDEFTITRGEQYTDKKGALRYPVDVRVTKRNNPQQTLSSGGNNGGGNSNQQSNSNSSSSTSSSPQSFHEKIAKYVDTFVRQMGKTGATPPFDVKTATRVYFLNQYPTEYEELVQTIKNHHAFKPKVEERVDPVMKLEAESDFEAKSENSTVNITVEQLDKEVKEAGIVEDYGKPIKEE